LPYRFGPLLQSGGERRLNVAVTRARRRMTVVSAFTAADMDPARSGAEGVRLLRAFLSYAESGGAELGAAAPARTEPGALERDIHERLVATGLPAVARYGVGGHRIEVALAHPTRPDEMVLAIETDAVTYPAASTARDRDRLRPEHLERLGWAFHRIWALDWFADPERQVGMVRQAYERALADRAGQPIRDTDTVVLPAIGRPIPRPDVAAGRSIGEYRGDDLVALVRWIESDTLLRTEDEVVDAMATELGFRRQGSRITAALTAAVRTARAQQETRGGFRITPPEEV
jgi:hypothetical protein